MTDTPTPEQEGNEATDPNAPQAAAPAPETSVPAAPEASAPAAPEAPAAPQAAPEFAPAAPAAAAAPAAPQDPNAAAGYPQPVAPATPPTNPLAIVSLIGSFFIGLVGIICGHIALSQIKKSNGQQGGRGLALAGTIIGYVNTAVWALVIIFWIVAMSIAGAAISAAGQDLQKQADELQQQVEELPETDPGAAEATGDRSPEFCEAFNELSAMGEDLQNSDGSVKAETVTVFQKLADISSPNQQVYQDFYGFLQDPGTASESLMSDYMKAAMEDAMACA